MRIAGILLVICSVALFYGCATIIHGTSQQIGVSSSPSGAKVTVDGNAIGVTPIFARLSRGDNHIIKIELDGYMSYDMTVTKKASGWVFGNIVFGGLIGLVVDVATGGLYDLSPDQIYGEMKKNGTAYILKDKSIIVATTLNPDPSWRKIGSLTKDQ